MVEQVAGDDETDQDDARRGHRRATWNTDPAADYPVGPDDGGNAVMHGVGLVVAAWRWLVAKVTKRA